MGEYLALLKSAAAGLGYALQRNVEVIGVKWPLVLSHKRTPERLTFSKLDEVSLFIQAEAKRRQK
jgi:hypothetical protein